MMNSKLESKFEYRGMKCVVLGQRMGHRCGYVKIDNPTEEMVNEPYNLDLLVHGGITYGKYSNHYPVETKESSFWLGFDCAHYRDGKDMDLIKELASKEEYNYMLKKEQEFPLEGIIRTIEYVEQELRFLVDQLLDLKEME